jgi:hypothetical protein
LHFLEEGGEDANTSRVMSTVLELERPDLAVLTGDTVSGSSIARTAQGAAQFAATWRRAVAPLQHAGTPWAMVLGNHDPDGPLTRAQVLALDRSLGGMAHQMAPPSKRGGVTNYYIELALAPDAPAAVAALFMLDIEEGGCEGVGGDDCVAPDIVRWFANASEALSTGRAAPMPTFLFLHVPPPQYMQLWNEEPCLGAKLENVCCPKVDTGLYAAAVASKGAQAMFCGHDHHNDYCGAFAAHPGVQLCYGRKSGYGYYNPPVHGARVIEIAVEPTTGKVTWASWIRDEYGKVVPQQWHQPTGPGQKQCGANGNSKTKGLHLWH